MEVTEHTRLDVHDQSQVGATRRHVAERARAAGMSETDVGRATLVATELTSNVVKHGGGGCVLVRLLREAGVAGVELITIDRGSGMPSVAASLRDGHSTAGTSGTGLGAISRTADTFDAYSAPGSGSAILARIWAGAAGGASPPPAPEVGGICVAKPGQSVSGDGWAVAHRNGRSTMLVVDGLGHGPAAAEATATGLRIFAHAAGAPTTEIVERLHAGLRATRGAALAVAELDRGRAVVRYCGIGNIAATILSDGTSRSLVSHHGTAGHDARRIQEFVYPCPPGALLVINSDGLQSSWTIDRYPGLLQRHPAVVAAVLYRDFSRGRDDTTVAAVRGAP